MAIPRPEYPRPELERRDWLNLNGEWDFTFDDANEGLADAWYNQATFDKKITVPYAFQTKLSGIEQTEFHDVVWYKRSFSVPADWAGKQILLHFGAVDYQASVWVNGTFVTAHEGGHTPFHADVTEALSASGENEVVVRAEDNSTDIEQPRGKQFWKEKSEGIYYTRTTGIWQTVWLEPVSEAHIAKVKLTPNIDDGEIGVSYEVSKADVVDVEITVEFDGEVVATESNQVSTGKAEHSLKLTDFAAGNGKLWSPDSPNLYQIAFQLKIDGKVVDEVTSYFGMRKISIEDGKVKLNNQPYYMKLVLDQGYYPDSLLTAPTDDDLKQDIELTKKMGFNGVRKHQKVEEPRYLYWADKLGLLVWGEMANAHKFSEKTVKRITAEWQEAVERDYNHPSVVVWVPLNESWGVDKLKSDPRQPSHALSLYYLTKSLDQTRPVIANDGWEHIKSDILSVHDYEGKKARLKERYGSMENILDYKPSDRYLYIPGFEYDGAPIHVSEFGGIAYKKSDWQGWGYTAASSDEDFIKRYYDVVSALLESPNVQGFCYTQITDVEQEINGLLTYDRKPKVDLDIIKKINEGQSI